MVSMLNPTAFITGASAGIGAATARLLALAGYNLILNARREERLKRLSAELKATAPSIEVQIAAFDLQNREETADFLASRPHWQTEVDVLINNAGLAAGADKLQDAKYEDWERMIDTNIKGLLSVTHFFIRGMAARQSGHIVNLGSVAGRHVYPGGAVYCATKFAVDALTQGLRMDLMGTGVRVSNIQPGMVETEFSEVRLQDADKAKKVYEGMHPLSADDIAETIVWTLSRPKHVNIQDLVIYPTDQAGVGHVYRGR